MRERDNQRKRLYDAQAAALPDFYTNVFGSVEQTQQWIDQVLAARWFRSRWQLAQVPVLRGGKGARSHHSSISLGTWARNPGVALHELAHQIITRCTPGGRGMPSHGPQFAAVYLFLVAQVMGEDIARKLRASFVEHRVRHRAAGAVPEPRYLVPAQRQPAAPARPPTTGERARAAEVIRRGVKAGEFGAVGSRTRTAALAVARTLERAGSAR
jgi:putative metallohydrolase (TIGR04338 family)